jgi:hypothetical protein
MRENSVSSVQKPLLSLSTKEGKANSVDFVSYGEGSDFFSKELVSQKKQNRKQSRKITQLEKSLSP